MDKKNWGGGEKRREEKVFSKMDIYLLILVYVYILYLLYICYIDLEFMYMTLSCCINKVLFIVSLFLFIIM
jgi:hypothetical protein